MNVYIHTDGQDNPDSSDEDRGSMNGMGGSGKGTRDRDRDRDMTDRGDRDKRADKDWDDRDMVVDRDRERERDSRRGDKMLRKDSTDLYANGGLTPEGQSPSVSLDSKSGGDYGRMNGNITLK